MQRRTFLRLSLGALSLTGALPLTGARPCAARAAGADPHTRGERRAFAAEAERMRLEAVAAGDQSYGAVLVMEGRVAGWGPSRVVVDRNPDAHAERVAIWNAQRHLGREDLAGAVLYSTSRPCALCEAAAARARVSLMRWGRDGAHEAHPRR